MINYGVVTLVNEPKSSPIISSVYGPNYLFFNQFIEKLSFVCFCYDKCQLVKNVSAIFINSVILSIFFLMIRRPPRSTQGVSSAASDVYKRQI